MCIQHLPPDKVDKREVVNTQPPINIGSITIEEVHDALRSSKTNKAPGPDGLTIELYKYLDEDNLRLLARILNQMWTEESYPDDFAYAEVVSIYKKGNPELPEHYRPISLLNLSYKIMTKILQKRIADATDQFVSDTQFGFRRGKSTSEPLFCVRRLQDLAEAGHQNIILIFLDWEKAFDRISHHRLLEALERMKIDAKMINNIKALYEHPFFKTIHNTEESVWKKTALWHTTGMSAIALSIYFNDERPVFRCEAQEQ